MFVYVVSIYFDPLHGGGMGWRADVELVWRRCAAAFCARSAASVCVFVVRLVDVWERGIYGCVFAYGYGYGYGGGRVVKLE